MIEIDGKYTSAKVFADEIDETSLAQIIKMVNSPAINGEVRIMPDFHAGKGSVVGFTMPVRDIVIPNVVGVDIGCGMLTFSIEKPKLSLEEINERIRKAVPLGFSIHSKNQFDKLDDVDKYYELAEYVGMDRNRLELSIGTLGGGNHFIELGKYEKDDAYYITIHSGSRNFGKMVAEFFQRKAEEFSSGAKDVVKDMEYLPVDEYLPAMEIAQDYASTNRYVMMRNILKTLDVVAPAMIECVHNYISPATKMIRKGAVSANIADPIILPFNRSEGIWIMTGLGNAEWNLSAPHGAGRRMSRGQAKRELTQEHVDLEMMEAGVFSTYNPIDEAPDAYKSPDEIKKYIGETAQYLYSIKPILNIKG